MRARNEPPILPAVKILQTLLAVCGALAVLSLGAFGAVAAPSEIAPCHQQDHHEPSPEKAPMAMKSMICCVACVTPLNLQATEVPAAGVALRRQVVPDALPAGRLPSPDHGPPRLPIV